MLFWPMMTLVGFLALTAVIVVLGSQSTSRYEEERRARPAKRHPKV